MINQTYLSCVVSAILIGTLSAPSLAGRHAHQVNTVFARDMYASRASILIIGDSTSHPRGDGNFTPYYEGFIQTLPDNIDLCGFRVSGSMGNTGINNYIRFGNGVTSQFVYGHIMWFAEDTSVGFTNHAPPGYRNEFRMVYRGVLPSTSHFASVGLTNLSGIYPNADQWIQDSTIVLRTPFFISNDGSMLTDFSIIPITDHDGSAYFNINNFESNGQVNVRLNSDRFGLQFADATFRKPKTSRIGVRFAGDTDINDENESGKHFSWCDHILFKKELSENNRGIYFDSISIGGFTAKDHAESLDPVILDDYFAMSPRPFNTVLIWLGQNAEMDEWNGALQPAWGQRVEAIADMAIQASRESGSSQNIVPILITPPQASGIYPSNRFTAMDITLNEIATRRGWGHIDLQTLVGSTIISVDPSYIADQVHPSQLGSAYLTELIYNHLDCLRADYTGDGARDFFDVTEFLTLFASMDPQADTNGDGAFDFFDVSSFLDAYGRPCP